MKEKLWIAWVLAAFAVMVAIVYLTSPTGTAITLKGQLKAIHVIPNEMGNTFKLEVVLENGKVVFTKKVPAIKNLKQGQRVSVIQVTTPLGKTYRYAGRVSSPSL